jgi:hypothetical protein
MHQNLHTIAIFPATMDVPLVAFTCELYNALSAMTRVVRLSSKEVVERLGEEAVLERFAPPLADITVYSSRLSIQEG